MEGTMNYHDIQKCDMLNGNGIRVTLFVSGCNHHCKNCQNPETWNPNSGIPFDENALNEIYDELKLDYIDGLTLSGGDPMNEANIDDIYTLVSKIKKDFPDKTIWIYTGYTYDELKNDNTENGEKRRKILEKCDVLVDGKFVEELKDVNYPYAGSTNQRIIYLNK